MKAVQSPFCLTADAVSSGGAALDSSQAVTPSCAVISEGFIGRFPRNKGFRNFSTLTIGKPLCRSEFGRKHGPKSKMAEFCSRRRLDQILQGVHLSSAFRSVFA
jgi:hypothetical protein